MLDIDSVKLELQTEVYFSYIYKYYYIEIYIENYKKKDMIINIPPWFSQHWLILFYILLIASDNIVIGYGKVT